MQIRRFRTGLWVTLALATFFAVCLFSPAKLLFDQAFLTKELDGYGSYAAFMFVLVFTVATTFGFPGNIMTIVGGAVFGVFWGTVWSVLGATLGAIGAFWVARHLLHDWAEHHFGHHPLLLRLKQTIARNPLRFVLAVRFSPLSPFSLVNFLFGLTPVDVKTYTIGTLIGIIPLSIAYAWIGVIGNQAIHGGDQLPLFLALGSLTLLTLLPMLKRKTPAKVQSSKILSTTK